MRLYAASEHYLYYPRGSTIGRILKVHLRKRLSIHFKNFRMRGIASESFRTYKAHHQNMINWCRKEITY